MFYVINIVLDVVVRLYFVEVFWLLILLFFFTSILLFVILSILVANL